MTARKRSLLSPVLVAAACAFAIIANQVAGKATRDALFLTNFDISALPGMLVAAALVSIGVVVLASRLMSRISPARVIPPLLVVSALLFVTEWFLAERRPRAAAVLLYLHVASLGSLLISGFWSIVNERFDPRTAKRGIGLIAGGATLGGLAGGLVAERIAAWTSSILFTIPVIAAFHIVAALLLVLLRAPDDVTETLSSRARAAGDEAGRRHESGFRVLLASPYLRNLAVIVLLGNVAATLVDFLFKARAAQTYATDAELVRFFAVFYTALSLVTFLVQAIATRPLLQRAGVANAVAVRPAVMAVGGLAALPFAGLTSLGLLRGAEAVLQGSWFRSGYELLYAPVAPDRKRATKAIVDVGADRVGDILGAGAIRGLMLLPAAVAGHVMIALSVVVSIAGFIVARALNRGYVRTLERSLIERADVLDISAADRGRSTLLTMDSHTGIDFSVTIDGIRLRTSEREADTAAQTVVARAPAAPVDPELATLVELRSGETMRVRHVLQTMHSMSPAVAANVIPLLAWDEASAWASRALAKRAPSIVGQLVDRLLDPDEDFAVRRRIPRILATSGSTIALGGLMASLTDSRFEVRFQSARALSRLHERTPSLTIDTAAVYVAVLREMNVEPGVWDSRRLIDEPEDSDTPAPAAGTDGNRSLEHVFTILSLVLSRAPLHIAHRALLTDDAVLRGTGMEYLESVLPRDVWERLLPHLDDTRPSQAAGKTQEVILDELMRSNQSIELNLSELRKRLDTSSG